VRIGLVGPNIVTSGRPRAAAMCMGPESFAMTSSAPPTVRRVVSGWFASSDRSPSIRCASVPNPHHPRSRWRSCAAASTAYECREILRRPRWSPSSCRATDGWLIPGQEITDKIMIGIVYRQHEFHGRTTATERLGHLEFRSAC
jgi:hypothetical protein